MESTSSINSFFTQIQKIMSWVRDANNRHETETSASRDQTETL